MCVCIDAFVHAGVCGGCARDGMESGSWCGLCVKHQEHHIDP